MLRKLKVVSLLLMLSLSTTVYAASAEESGSDLELQNLSDTTKQSVDNDASDTATDQSTSISTQGTSDYPGASLLGVSAGASVGASVGYSTSASSSRGTCGVQVNNPHASYTESEEIHTRIVSFCKNLPLASNTISGKTYRSRWYGWQRVATFGPKTVTAASSTVQNRRETVVAKCKAGDWYRYRTEGFGTVVTLAGQRLSASAYEENDDEIVCERR